MKITNLQKSVVDPKEKDIELVISSLVSTTDAVTHINTDLLVEYEGQPFKPYSAAKLIELAEDIKINGVLSPIIVRPVDDGKYQILAGHNRTAATKLAGLSTVPAVIKPCDDDTAKLIVVNTNLNQRQELLPSEKAFAYKMQLEAMKHQGVTSRQVVGKLETADIIGQNNNESGRQIQRYIRLTYLIKPLLDMVDTNKMAFMVGVNLSFLSENNQSILYNLITDNKIKITLSQSEELKRLNLLGDFTLEDLDAFFNPPEEETKKAKSKYTLKLTKAQYDTVVYCLKSQKENLSQSEIFNEVAELFEID